MHQPKKEKHTEDAAYKAYRKETDPARRKLLEEQLIQEMTGHGLAVCWLELHERRPDVVNDAIFKALSGVERYRGDAAFSTWFHRIVINACMDEKRRLARRKEETLDETTAVAVEVQRDEWIDFEREAGKLDEEDAGFLVDKVAGLDENELAAKYKLTGRGVRSRWFRIRNRLKGKKSATSAARTAPKTSTSM